MSTATTLPQVVECTTSTLSSESMNVAQKPNPLFTNPLTKSMIRQFHLCFSSSANVLNGVTNVALSTVDRKYTKHRNTNQEQNTSVNMFAGPVVVFRRTVQQMN
ncbi:hypothetical protein DPMN_130332 [Dreissena polymorpha]|uniref:Uncharacterized protein n=1 Tax=Dreissena polymorpha TaxID=45954 RepID=A0A9D4H7K1_DREPO|nr:hypothetical protein DPMN_130332 [Dreissena polymorpha]